MSTANSLRWARRVHPDVIRRLYASDARGIQDEDLVNEAGYAIYARCESIRVATEAHFGRATCSRCRSVIVRAGWSKEELMRCDCGWSLTWAEYHQTYKRKQLVGGKAYPFFTEFIESWPGMKMYRDKLLAIDKLIHALHVDATHGFARPAACNLIECTLREALALMNELAYGASSTPGVSDTKELFDTTVAAMIARRRELAEGS